jgi:hypothetical protein
VVHRARAIDAWGLVRVRMSSLQPGIQIIYVPLHAQGDTQHPDCEAGFVTSVRETVAFCRYWSKHTPGELRTKANSEATPLEYLVVQDTVPQEDVRKALVTIYKENNRWDEK